MSGSRMQAVASACRLSVLARGSIMYHSIPLAHIFRLTLVRLLLMHYRLLIQHSMSRTLKVLDVKDAL
jgi:hypothetical protein